MPKKMGMNSKAAEARERKEVTKKNNMERAAKEADDRLWCDNDKNLAKKQQRREEDERKRVEAARRKAESRALLDQEMSSISTQGKQSIAKISRQKMLEELEKKQSAIDTNKHSNTRVVAQQDVIEENLNRSMADTNVATNVDQALSVLGVNENEKGMRAAYKRFEASNLPRIKQENPTLRMSQWKQLLMKEWNKSPDNPFNQVR